MVDPPGRIVVSGLSKRFGEIRAVDGLSFVVEPGSVTGFLGPNGAGKTTTLRMLLGLVTPTAGTATIGGSRYAEIPTPTRAVGAVLESASFHPARTARNHLRVYAAAAGLPDDRADAVLGLVGLADSARRKVRGYSLGMRQRLGLAFALLGDPQVLILDEPANGLDPEGIRWLRGFLRSYADAGRTVLVSSHLLAEMEQAADRIVIISRGRLIRQGTLTELTSGTAETVVVRSPQAAVLAEAVRAAQPTGAPVTDAQTTIDERPLTIRPTGPDELRIGGLDAAAVGHIAFTSAVELHELRTERSDLEQIFLELTGDGGSATGTDGMADVGVATGEPGAGPVTGGPPAHRQSDAAAPAGTPTGGRP